MIVAYTLSADGKVTNTDIDNQNSIPPDTFWIDMLNPTLNDEDIVSKALSINIPTREEMGIIEVMTPFYQEDETYYMTITAINQNSNDYLESSALTFILTSSCLITLRYCETSWLKTLSSYVLKKPELCNPNGLLVAIAELALKNVADILDEAGSDTDSMLKTLFDKRNKPLRKSGHNHIISKIGQTGNIVSKTRESLVSINRFVIYYRQLEAFNDASKKTYKIKLKHMAREAFSLSEYADFLAQRNSFLLEATLGMISVEQNMVIKFFTVASAVFMPPTLIASIYGMNFKHMPELDWTLGYPMAIVLIVVSGLIPYFFFKGKGWL